MSSTVRTSDLRTTTIRIGCPPHTTRDRIIEGRPAAPRVELHIRREEWSVTLTTDEDSFLTMSVEFSSIWSFSSFPDDNTSFF